MRANPIVLVDDNFVEREFVEMCHARAAISPPLVCLASAEEVLDYIAGLEHGESRSPLLLLVDIRMPRMDGFELVEVLHDRYGSTSLPPVVFFTTAAHPDDANRARALGAELVTKPYGVDGYVEFLRDIPRRATP